MDVQTDGGNCHEEEKPKPRGKKNDFKKELIKEFQRTVRSGKTMTSVKTSNMETDTEKQGKFSKRSHT